VTGTVGPRGRPPQTDVVLRDGSTARLRPVGPDDVAGLEAFLEGLSAESLLLRYFSGAVDIERAAYWAAHPESADGYGVVALTGADDRIIAHGCFERTGGPDGSAEVALAVADVDQGRGLGTLLVGHLAEVADDMGVEDFIAHVLPENHRMLRVLRDVGYPVTRRAVSGEIEIAFPTALTPQARGRFERREQLAAAAALRHVLAPSSVAVIGASRRRGTPGGEVFHNLVSGGFAGPVYPVNPATDVVQSVAAYATIADVPGPVELAVIAVPATAVVAVARGCAAAGVRALVVLSAGFAETGPEGAARQDELVAVCRQAGMRLVGPNCLGVLNTDPVVRLNAQFGPDVPGAGRVGFLSQSGALGLAIIDHAKVLGLGLSTFVSVGNKADLSGNDLLQYWADDRDTDVILLYLESFGNPRRFARIARQVGRIKPIVAVKSGRTTAGARAASSHTGALLRTSDRTVDALFRQTGVVRTDTLEELFDVASLLANQPLPDGHRVGIVTNAGGPGILCADACVAEGLRVVGLSERTRAALRSVLPVAAAVDNPVDTLAAVPADQFRQAITLVGASGDVDAVIAIYIPPLAGDRAILQAMRGATTELAGRVPVLHVLMSSTLGSSADPAGLPRPVYAFPEDAVRALARAADHTAWRRRADDEAAQPAGVRSDEASAVLAAAIGDRADGRWLHADEIARLFACYGIPLLATRSAGSAEEVVAAAGALDGPVAVKGVADGLVHKTDVGAVRLDLTSKEQVSQAADDIAAAVGAAGHELAGYLVQPMAGAGVELLVGVTHDPMFGPVVVCGAGGTAVELLHDIAVRLTPLTARDASEMVRSLATFPLLDGYRGAPPADVAALEDVLLRVSAMADDHPVIAELDCNPVVVRPDGAVVVDARVLVRPVPSRWAPAVGLPPEP
jgi:acetyl coenzyme A synthetase (ADP forming)-like protein